jgi:hypothetical protein
MFLFIGSQLSSFLRNMEDVFVVVSNVRLHESPFFDPEPDIDEIEKKSLCERALEI